MNRHAPTSRRSSQRGVAMIETALTLPLVLLVIFGIFNFGFALYNKSVITNASREAARAGIVYTAGANDAAIKTYAEDVARQYCTGRMISLGAQASCVPVATISGNDLHVRVNYTFGNVAGAFVGIGNAMELSSQTVMRLEI